MNNNSDMKEKNDLTVGAVGRKLFYLTLPMVLGIFSIVVFNFADTFFVAQLGTKELAAMSFTFPVVLLIGSVAIGLGTATASVISRAIGEGSYQKVRRLTTDSLILAFLIVIFLIIIGLITMKPVFTFLGATPDIFLLIKEYMTVWYIGMAFLVIPMVGNNAIRASGDTKIPSLIMMVSAGINVILDPLLIFGLFGFPKLGLLGAALATVIARAMALAASLAILCFRKKMLDFSFPKLRPLLDSWKNILYIGIPSAVTNTLVPLSMGVVTKLGAQFGPVAVAAIGAGIRVEAFALMVIMALSSALIPFVGQNWGAKRFDRVRLAQEYSSRFSFWWGIVNIIVFFIIARPLGRLFSNDPGVINNIIRYLWIVPFGYSLRGIRMLAVSVFIAINKPLTSAAINIIWVFTLYIPFAYIGSKLFSLNGLFVGITLANIIAGIISFLWIKNTCRVEVVKAQIANSTL